MNGIAVLKSGIVGLLGGVGGYLFFEVASTISGIDAEVGFALGFLSLGGYMLLTELEKK